MFQTVCHFPLLQFVNEPMSHLVSGEVRKADSSLADRIHYECGVPNNIHESYLMGSPYDSTVITSENSPLSNPISYTTMTPSDGDGLITNIDRSRDNPLQDVVYVRLHGIHAPEISAVHYFKTDDLSRVFIKRMGHLSLCGIQFFLRLFLLEGNAEFCEQLPKEDFDVRVDTFNRPLKEFWFRFSSPEITEQEENYINYLELLLSGRPEVRQRLVSPFSITQASTSNYFLISLNTLLVLTGFSHVFTKFSQDNHLLALQEIAKEKKVHVGPLWCGSTRSFIYGAQNNPSDDVILKHFTPEATVNATQSYYTEKILPWHERKIIKQLCSPKTTRSEANENLTKALPGKEPHSGMYTDITRQVHVQYVNLAWPDTFW